jgi:hypothetical protein
LRVGAFAGPGELDEHGESVATSLLHANTPAFMSCHYRKNGAAALTC